MLMPPKHNLWVKHTKSTGGNYSWKKQPQVALYMK